MANLYKTQLEKAWICLAICSLSLSKANCDIRTCASQSHRSLEICLPEFWRSQRFTHMDRILIEFWCRQSCDGTHHQWSKSLVRHRFLRSSSVLTKIIQARSFRACQNINWVHLQHSKTQTTPAVRLGSIPPTMHPSCLSSLAWTQSWHPPSCWKP